MNDLIATLEQFKVQLAAVLADMQTQIDTVRANDTATGDWVTTIINQYDAQFQTINEQLAQLSA